MDCPFCGAEMESGVLQGGGGYAIGWREKASLFPNVFNIEYLEDMGVWRAKRSLPALRCVKCRKIIVSY